MKLAGDFDDYKKSGNYLVLVSVRGIDSIVIHGIYPEV